MKIRAILETETMDPDFREPFLNGMPFDITESYTIYYSYICSEK